jgi:hypothetical protein
MRRLYASDSYAIDKARRLRRIKRRAVSELQKAFESGELSLRKFDMLSRLSPRQQRRILATEKARSAATLVAAEAINDLLSRQAGPVRLSNVELAIRKAVLPL